MDSEIARMIADARVEIKAHTLLLLHLYAEVAPSKGDALAFVASAERQLKDSVDVAALPSFAGYDPEILKHGVLFRLEKFFERLEGFLRKPSG